MINAEFQTITLPELRCKGELRRVAAHLQANRYNLIIVHPGAVLGFLGRHLGAYIPDRIHATQRDSAVSFTAASLSVDWFKRQASIVQCTRHGRFSFWLVRPDLMQFLPITEESSS